MSVLRAGLVLGTSEVTIALLRFSRNLLLARLLGVEEYGLAATFLILVALSEGLTNFGFAQFVVRERDGAEPRVLGTVQTLVSARALVTGVLLLLAAPWVAALFGEPELKASYRWLALVFALRCGVHIDRFRRQRELRFGANAAVELSGLAVSLALLWPVSGWLDDHRILLVLLGAETLTRLAMSHAIAERPFRIGWSAAIAARVLRFGTPLVLGGLVVVIVTQGDRLVVGSVLGTRPLGLMTAALALALTPMLLLARVLSLLALAALSRRRDAPATFAREAGAALEACLVASALGMAALTLAGPAALVMLFGEAYREAAPLLVPAAVLAGLPLLRQGIAALAIAEGRTLDTLLPDLARAVALPIALLRALDGATISEIFLIGIAGELVAGATAAALLVRRREGRAILRGLWRPGLLWLGLAGALLALPAEWTALGPYPTPPALGAATVLGLAAAVLAAATSLRRHARELIRRAVRR